MNQKVSAAFQVIMSGFLFGFLGIWGKWAFSLGLSYGELLSLRFLLAACILFAYLFWVNRNTYLRFPWLSGKALTTCILLGVLGYAVFSSCYFLSLKGLSASMAVLLLYLYPIFVAIGARIFLHEKLGTHGVIAIALASLGLILLVWGDFSIKQLSSFLIGVTSAVTYSIYILVSKKYLKPIDPIVSTCWIQFGTGVVLLILHFHSFKRIADVISIGWLPIVGISIISTIFSMILFMHGLKYLTSAQTSILNTSEPITAILAAHFLLGESLSNIQIGGGALVLLAMILISRGTPQVQVH